MYVTGRPVIPPPGNPGTDAGPRQPPTPPPSGVVEPPERSNDQANSGAIVLSSGSTPTCSRLVVGAHVLGMWQSLLAQAKDIA